MNRIVIFPLLILIAMACSPSPQVCGLQASIPSSPSSIEHRPSSRDQNIYIKLYRGAFQYDSFILSDQILTYIPDPETTKGKYSKKSSVNLTTTQVDELRKMLHDAKVFSLQKEYKSNWSCNSSLKIDITIDGQSTTIKCEDYVKQCPKVLQKLEEKMIEWHGKGLKRTKLPG